MDYELLVVQGRSAVNTLKLADGVTTIGRHDECQLRIKSSQVSRKHCQLFEKKGLLLVKDLGSSNGTLVNGKRIEGQRVLEAGDELTIGPIQLRVTKSGVGSATTVTTKPKTAPKPGDTAVNAPAVAGVADADDFIVDFEQPTGIGESPTAVVPSPQGKAPAKDEDAFSDLLMDVEIDGDDDLASAAPPEPVTKPTPRNETAKPSPKKEAAKGPEQPKEGSDDAIADFLLDIKLDDDE
jgi:pSer/pThr/pTyr-binding forkhead associated (FHA) protein